MALETELPVSSNSPWQNAKDLKDLLTHAPAAPAKAAGVPVLTRTQKKLVGLVTAGAIVIAGLGFAGSYSVVARLAVAKGFGWYSRGFPIGVDAGIVVFLALDLVLTGLRMPYALLRPAAWFLTAATIGFNASVSWGDWVAVGMHAVIPLLFVVVVEAARHAVCRIAEIEAAKFIESPPLIRWVIAPIQTLRIWRRMRMWQIPCYTDVVQVELEARIHRKKLKLAYGRRRWRSQAPSQDILALTLARYGTPIRETLATAAAELSAATERALAQAAVTPPSDSAGATPDSATGSTPATATGSTRESTGGSATRARSGSESGSSSRTVTRSHRRSQGERKSQDKSAPGTRGRTPNNVSGIDAIPQEMERLVALMKERGSATAVSLTDAKTITGKSESTAARRLSDARQVFDKTA